MEKQIKKNQLKKIEAEIFELEKKVPYAQVMKMFKELMPLIRAYVNPAQLSKLYEYQKTYLTLIRELAAIRQGEDHVK